MKRIFTNPALIITVFIGIFLLILYWPVLGFPFRAEHWNLVILFVTPMPMPEKLWRILTFACGEAVRIQPLGFFIPYISFLAFGDSFLTHQLICLFFHLCSVFLVVNILNELDCPLIAQFWAALVFGISYCWSDILNWSFYSYVFFHGFTLFLALYCLVLAFKRNASHYLIFHFIFASFSSFAYESGFALFLADTVAVSLGWRFVNRSKNDIKPLFIFWTKWLPVFACVTLLPFGLYYWSAGTFDPSSNTRFHLGIAVKVLFFIKQIFVNGFGFSRPVAIEVMPYLSSASLNLNLWNILVAGLVLVGLAVLIQTFNYFRSHEKNNSNSIYRYGLWIYCAVLLILYVGSIAYGRVRPEDYQSNSFEFEHQMRYFYVPMALTGILVSLFITNDYLKQKRWAFWTFAVFLLVYSLGNAANIVKLNRELAEPYSIMNKHYQEIHERCKKIEQDDSKCRIEEFFKDFYNERIKKANASLFKNFIYSAKICATPGNTYKKGVSLPPSIGEGLFSDRLWNIAADDSSCILLASDSLYFKTQSYQRAVALNVDPLPARQGSFEGLELAWKSRLMTSPRWDYNGAFVYLRLNGENRVQVSLFKDYVEVIFNENTSVSIPINENSHFHLYKIRLTTSTLVLLRDNQIIANILLPTNIEINPSFFMIGDLSAEPNENIEAEFKEFSFRYF